MAFCLSCYFGGKRLGVITEILHAPPNCESAVINTKSKLASLPFTDILNMDQGLPDGLQHHSVHRSHHGLQWQHRRQTPKWPLLKHMPQTPPLPSVVGWLHRQLTSTWPLASSQPTEISMASGDSINHEQLHSLW